MSLKKIGNWKGVEKFVNNLGANMDKARIIILKRWALKAEAIAKLHINKQDLNWTKLDPKTISMKVRKGFSENILVMTSSYFQSITSWVDGDTGYAGVQKKARNEKGEELADIAATHEYGSRSGNIPARPLWQPTYNETIEWFKRSKEFAKVLTKILAA